MVMIGHNLIKCLKVLKAPWGQKYWLVVQKGWLQLLLKFLNYKITYEQTKQVNMFTWFFWKMRSKSIDLHFQRVKLS